MSDEELGWPSIALKELLAIVLWLEAFGRFYQGCLLLCGTDNYGNVFTVDRLRVRAGDHLTAALLERLLAAAAASSIVCLLWWCPRTLNGASDVISKCPTSLDARRKAETLGLTLHDLSNRIAEPGTTL
jgi:hypothetical protein